MATITVIATRSTEYTLVVEDDYDVDHEDFVDRLFDAASGDAGRKSDTHSITAYDDATGARLY